MRRYVYILIAVLFTLTGCQGFDGPQPLPGTEQGGERVTISFKVAVPDGGATTRAMGNTPTIDPDGFYVAVFGGSGYFNEWVKATVQAVSPANYDTTSATIYTLEAMLSVSDSRLRLHFIANCPTSVRTSPPISGSQDTEEHVLSKIRSQRGETYNDGYWQKVILPNGVRVNKVGNTYVATPETMAQFPDPIILVRDFARIYLRNLTPIVGETGHGHQLVTIKKFGLAYAPAEGVIAPILSAPYISDVTGRPIAEPAENDTSTPIYYESFFRNYQRYGITRVNQQDTLLTEAPFNYYGYSPANQSYDYYNASTHSDVGIPLESDLQTWDNEHPENNVLFVYERTRPSASRRATRVIILAERVDQDGNSDGDRFYALDIVNPEGVAIALLRNQTYTVHLLNIEAGSGETDITKASEATSATVSGDPNFQNLINISDGTSSIGTSFTEKFYVQPQLDSVMFRYIPTNITDDNYEANQEGNELVTIKVGALDASTGVFTQLTAAQAAAQGILSFATEADDFKVWIVKDNSGNAIPFIRQQNRWTQANATQINDPSIEKWGMIKYQLNESYKDEANYFTEERAQAIHVVGAYEGSELSRDIVIKTSPRQEMRVVCQQKFVMESAGEEEVVRIMIPQILSRSVFPLEFTLESNSYSLTPDGDVLPVSFGKTTVPGKSGPAYYFIRTLTQTEYESLGTITANGKTWKYFDCHFKTTIPRNASTVYVNNRYFNNVTASDEFFNFQQRLFTRLTLPSTVYRHGDVDFTFVLDEAHAGNTCVWWDPQNELGQSANAAEAEEKGLSTSNRVLPPIMTVILHGLTPRLDENDNMISSLEHVRDSIYRYYVGSGEPNSGMAGSQQSPVSLALVATGAIGSPVSVTLSTANLTDNPQLYATAYSSSVNVQGASFTGLTFTGGDVSGSSLALGLNKTTTFRFTYVSGMVVPITVSFNGLALNGADSRFSDNGDGTYTFTPANTNVTQEFSVKSTTRFTQGTVVLNHEDYVREEGIIARATNFVIPANALRARNAAGTGSPSNVTTGTGWNSTDVYVNNEATYANFTTFKVNNTYYNNGQVTITLSNFVLTDDDAPVYFAYRSGSYNNYSYYYAISSLSELIDASTSNVVALRFKSSRTVTINTTNTNYNNRTSYTSDGVTVAFSAISNRNNNYVTIADNETVTVSTTAGYHITSIVFSYRTTNYYPQSVTILSGGGSYSGTTTGTWTASDNTTTSVQLRLQKRNSYDDRMASVAVTLIED